MIRKILMTKLVDVTLSLYFLLMPFIVVTLFWWDVNSSSRKKILFSFSFNLSVVYVLLWFTFHLILVTNYWALSKSLNLCFFLIFSFPKAKPQDYADKILSSFFFLSDCRFTGFCWSTWSRGEELPNSPPGLRLINTMLLKHLRWWKTQLLLAKPLIVFVPAGVWVPGGQACEYLAFALVGSLCDWKKNWTMIMFTNNLKTILISTLWTTWA